MTEAGNHRSGGEGGGEGGGRDGCVYGLLIRGRGEGGGGEGCGGAGGGCRRAVMCMWCESSRRSRGIFPQGMLCVYKRERTQDPAKPVMITVLQ